MKLLLFAFLLVPFFGCASPRPPLTLRIVDETGRPVQDAKLTWVKAKKRFMSYDVEVQKGSSDSYGLVTFARPFKVNEGMQRIAVEALSYPPTGVYVVSLANRTDRPRIKVISPEDLESVYPVLLPGAPYGKQTSYQVVAEGGKTNKAVDVVLKKQ